MRARRENQMKVQKRRGKMEGMEEMVEEKEVELEV